VADWGAAAEVSDELVVVLGLELQAVSSKMRNKAHIFFIFSSKKIE
jgi:hypothetical protein